LIALSTCSIVIAFPLTVAALPVGPFGELGPAAGPHPTEIKTNNDNIVIVKTLNLKFCTVAFAPSKVSICIIT
jgi:hypothetical protein